MGGSKHLVGGGIGRQLQIQPHLPDRVALIGVTTWERLPRLHMDSRIVQEVGVSGHILLVTCVPSRIQLSPQSGHRTCFGLHRLAPLTLCRLKRPDGRHPRTVKQHHRGVAVGERQEPMVAQISVK